MYRHVQETKMSVVLHICTKSHNLFFVHSIAWSHEQMVGKGDAVAQSVIDPLGALLRFGFLGPFLCRESS